MAEQSEIEEVKSKLNIVDVVADYVQLKKAGANFKARCPFHQERTPSFNVSPSRQIFHCFGCGKGGDVIEFVKEIESVDFPAALRQLADRAGVTLEQRSFTRVPTQDNSALYQINNLAAKYYHKVLLESPKALDARDYLAKRNFTTQTIADWQLGYAIDSWDNLVQFLRKRDFSDNDIINAGVAGRSDPASSAGGQGRLYDRFRDRITFPIYENAWGKIVGFAARILHPKEGTGKYINTPETRIYSKSKVIYGLHQAKQAIRALGSVVVVEGNVDVVKSVQAGIRNIVASSGTAFTESQRTALRRLTEKLIFAFDNDEAGRLAARRAIEPEIAAGFQTYIAPLPENFKDADELIDADPKLWQESISQARDYIDFDREAKFAKLDRQDTNIFGSAIRDHLMLIALVENSVKAEEYCSKLASTTGNSMPAIVRQLNDLRSQIRRPAQDSGLARQNSQANKHNPTIKIEERFIGLLLHLAEQANDFYDHNSSEHFLDSDFAKLFGALKLQRAKSGRVALSELADIEPKIINRAQQAAYVLEAEPMEEVDPLRELSALSYRLRAAYLSRKQEQLAKSIAALEARHGDVSGLRQEFDELVKRKQELSNN